MIDQDANAGIAKHRHHRYELVVLDLDIDEHVEFDQFLQQRACVAVVVDTVVRDVPCHADDVRVLECTQFVQRRVVGDYRDAFIPSAAMRNGVQHACVVQTIA